MVQIRKRLVVVSTVATVLTAATAAARVAAAQELERAAVVEPKLAPGGMQATDISDVMRSLTARAGVIFVGEVEKIRPTGGVMEIIFGIQQRVVGDLGDTYILREWAGRWAAGQQHYRVGQRAMIFLNAPNAAGLSSPVDGMAGVIPLIPMGADAEPLLDVRALSTELQRPVGAPLADSDFGAVALVDALAIVKGAGTGDLPRPIRRPLPVGLRPMPVKTWSEEASQPDMANVPVVVLQPRATDVEP